jgi:hypothetical protein
MGVIPVKAIEKVIGDFEAHVKKYEHYRDIPTIDAECTALEHAIEELKKVLSEYAR